MKLAFLIEISMYRQIHRNCPQRWIPSLNGGPPLEFINIQPPKMGSTSRIHQHTTPLKRWSTSRIYQHTAPHKGSASTVHQHTAPQKGVHLQNLSTKGGPPLDSINQMGVCLLQSVFRIHQPKNGGSASRDNFYGSRGTLVAIISMSTPPIYSQTIKPNQHAFSLVVKVNKMSLPHVYSEPHCYLGHQSIL